jgi:hypothetical protein
MALSEIFVRECSPGAVDDELRKLEFMVRIGLRPQQEKDAMANAVMIGGAPQVPLAPVDTGIEIVAAQRQPETLIVLFYGLSKEQNEMLKSRTPFLLMNILEYNWVSENRACAIFSLLPGVFSGPAAVGGVWEKVRGAAQKGALAAISRHAVWPVDKVPLSPWKTTHDALFRTLCATAWAPVLERPPEKKLKLDKCMKCGEVLYDMAIIMPYGGVNVQEYCLLCAGGGTLVPVLRTKQNGCEMAFNDIQLLAVCESPGQYKLVVQHAFAVVVLPTMDGVLAAVQRQLQRIGLTDVPELEWDKNIKMYRG